MRENAPPAPWTIWSNRRYSSLVSVFMSALKFSKANWQWVDDQATARWWLVDCSACDPADHSALFASYRDASHGDSKAIAPSVALLYPQPPAAPPAHYEWQVFTRPFRVPDVLSWMDAVGAKSAATASLKDPWRTLPFMLVRWPNMAHYGNDIAVIVACSHLIGKVVNYAQAQSLGLDDHALDLLLRQAYQGGQLQIATAQTPTLAAASPNPNHPKPPGTAAPHHEQGLIRRVLQKFARL